MAFVRDFLERLRHPGVHPRGPGITLSNHVEELRERQEETHRRQSRRDQPPQERQQLPPVPKPAGTAKRVAPQPLPEAPPREPGVVVDGDAARRWVPRSS